MKFPRICLKFMRYCFIATGLFSQTAMANIAGVVSVNDTSVYYQEAGSGQTIIFIPGWTGTHVFFERQLPYFSKKYRAITFDPRGQGLSPATLDHNTYEQHGQDVSDLIDRLQLKNVILVGWSFGCRDAYAYIRRSGTANVKAFVCIDQSPKGQGAVHEWHSSGAGEGRQKTSWHIEHNRYTFTQQLVQAMNDRALTPQESQCFVEQMLHTPSYVALLLMGDASLTDYTSEAELLDKQGIPVLNVVATPLAPLASAWLKIHAPHAKLVTTWDKHMLFWEHADAFNPMLADFLTKNKL